VNTQQVFLLQTTTIRGSEYFIIHW